MKKMKILNKFGRIGLVVALVASLLLVFTPVPVNATDTIVEPFTTKIETNKYVINYSGEEVIVGKGTDTFVPEITLYRFGTETSVTLGEPLVNGEPLSQKNASSTITDNVISWASKDIEFNFYPVAIDSQNELGSFEYNMSIANSKAGTGTTLNSISFPMTSIGLSFYYQPELTQEEIDANTIRPENVVGSYAVYHSTKRDHIIGQTNYKSGKAFHIYRPMLVDNAGDTVYADIIITDGWLTIDYSNIEDWLDKAKYPVSQVAGLEFGYHSLGGSSTSYEMAAGLYPGVAGLAIDVYLGWASAFSDIDTYGGLYEADDSLFAWNGPVEVPAFAIDAWYQYSVFGTLSAQDYYITGAASSSIGILYDTTGSVKHHWYDLFMASGNWDDWPSTHDMAEYNANREVSVYVEYIALIENTVLPSFTGSVTIDASSGSRNSATFNHTTPDESDRLIVVIVGYDRGFSEYLPTGVTYDAVGLALATTINTGSTDWQAVDIWYLKAPAVGSNEVIVTYSGIVNPDVVAVLSYTGVNQTLPIGTTAGAIGDSNSPSVDITTGIDNAMIVGGLFMMGGDTDPFAEGSDIIERYDGATGTSTIGDSGYWGGEKELVSAGATTIDATANAADGWAIAAIEIIGVEAGGGPELDIISNFPNKAFGIIKPGTTYSTGLDWCSLQNVSGAPVDGYIYGTDWIGGTSWDLSDTATPGEDIIGWKAGLDGGSYNVIIRESESFSLLFSDLADDATIEFGHQILTPTVMTDAIAKTGTYTVYILFSD